jgi:DNA repair protein RadD
MPTLRPYQSANAAEIRQAASEGCKRVLFVGVTAYGKTNLFCSFAKQSHGKGRSLWVLTHRRSLRLNTLATMAAWGVPCGSFDADGGHDGQLIQVVMKDTLAARLKKGWRPPAPPDVLIMDEADLVESGTWQAAIHAFPAAFVLGFTGTPERLDGRGLGNTFERMILGPSPRWMMDSGFIARPRYMPQALGEMVNIRGKVTVEAIAEAVEAAKPRIVGDTVAHYLLHGRGLPFLGSAINITHAERFNAAWREAGVRSEVIHSGLSETAQDVLFERLRARDIDGLWSVDMMGRGVDVPSVKYLCCARPTHSLAWWLQWLGRAIRIDGQTRPVIADHVGNLWRHGTVEMGREWTLEGVSKRKREKELLAAVCQCPSCFVMFEKAACCPECGHEMERRERELKGKRGSLNELTAKEIEEVAQAAAFAKSPAGIEAAKRARLIRAGFARGEKDPVKFARDGIKKDRQAAELERIRQILLPASD